MPPSTARMVMTQYSLSLYRCIGINGWLRGTNISEARSVDPGPSHATRLRTYHKNEGYYDHDANYQRHDNVSRVPGIETSAPRKTLCIICVRQNVDEYDTEFGESIKWGNINPERTMAKRTIPAVKRMIPEVRVPQFLPF